MRQTLSNTPSIIVDTLSFFRRASGAVNACNISQVSWTLCVRAAGAVLTGVLQLRCLRSSLSSTEGWQQMREGADDSKYEGIDGNSRSWGAGR